MKFAGIWRTHCTIKKYTPEIARRGSRQSNIRIFDLYAHSWARTPQILRARGGGLLHKVRTLLQWDPEARGGGGFITLTPCMPRYVYAIRAQHEAPNSKVWNAISDLFHILLRRTYVSSVLKKVWSCTAKFQYIYGRTTCSLRSTPKMTLHWENIPWAKKFSVWLQPESEYEMRSTTFFTVQDTEFAIQCLLHDSLFPLPLPSCNPFFLSWDLERGGSWSTREEGFLVVPI